MNEDFLSYRRYRYLKAAGALSAAALLAYGLARPLGGPSGGTPLGLAFGTLSAALILGLLAFGIRKRSYSGTSHLVGWLSAHVYLGLFLVLLAALHAGLRFGANVHTLAYALLVLVVASGLVGVVLYRRLPEVMAGNRRGEPLRGMLARLAELDAEARATVQELPAEVASVVLGVGGRTQIGGSAWQQLSGAGPDSPEARAFEDVSRLSRTAEPGSAARMENLLAILARKRELVERARRDVRWRALLKVWLYLHVPLSVALVAAVIAHVVWVFFF